MGRICDDYLFSEFTETIFFLTRTTVTHFCLFALPQFPPMIADSLKYSPARVPSESYPMFSGSILFFNVSSFFPTVTSRTWVASPVIRGFSTNQKFISENTLTNRKKIFQNNMTDTYVGKPLAPRCDEDSLSTCSYSYLCPRTCCVWQAIISAWLDS